MRLTIRTNLALRTLMVCAVNTGQLVRKSDVARVINASENHLAQVVNQLGQLGYLATHRGRQGGFELASAPSEIRVGRVFRAFETDTPFVECFGPDNACPLAGSCRLGVHMKKAIDAFYAVLDEVTLADLVDCNDALDGVLSLERAVRLVPETACLRAAS